MLHHAVIILLVAVLCVDAYTDPQCANYNHPTYGRSGQCIETSQCPGRTYISNLCPTQRGSIKCCFTSSSSTSSGSCSSRAQSLACTIQSMAGRGQIRLLSVNPSGVNDGADPRSNIRDACLGREASRSSYNGRGCTTIGGSTCLSPTVLQYIIDVANSGQYSRPLQVNAIAGACHSRYSRHYRGTAVDFHIKSGDSSYARSWMTQCANHGARENLGPGHRGHLTHTHCAFSS